MASFATVRSAAPLLSALLALGCGGDSTAPVEAVPTTIFIANGAITLTEVGETLQLDVSVLDQAGATIPDAAVTYLTSADAVATVSTTGLVTAVGSGNAEITVQSGAATGTVPLDVILAPTALELGTAIELSGGTASQQFFTIEVPAGPPNRLLEVRIWGGFGDADVAVRLGDPPDTGTFDCASADAATFPDNLDFCALHGPSAGTWHVLVLGFLTFSELQLQADILTPTPLLNGVPATGLAAATAEVRYFTFEVPPPAGAAAFQATGGQSPAFSLGGDLTDKARSRFSWDWSAKTRGETATTQNDVFADGTLTVAAEGGSGDSDLFGSRSAQASLDGIGSSPCISFNVGTGDSCDITDPTDGFWNILLLGFEAFDDVSLTATFTPPQGDAPPMPARDQD